MRQANQTGQSEQPLASVLTSAPQPQDAALMSLGDHGQPVLPGPIKVKHAEPSPMVKATGPRTEAGKSRSSRNGIRHGIFSEVTVLPGESGNKYRSLRKELRSALQPVGGVEDLLVDKLASLAWRHRRLLVAEGAETRWGSEFWELDQRAQQRQRAEDIRARNANPLLRSDPNNDLIRNIHNSFILKQCLELLLELRREIEAGGFEYERDAELLTKIYGLRSHQEKNLCDFYPDCAVPGEKSEEDDEAEAQECATPEESKSNFLAEMDDEIRRLRDYQKERGPIESERMKVEVLRRNVPEPERLDRLLRYEASLERSFDRTLNQLERIQRLRRGQPVAPRIDVNVSTGA